MTRMRGAFLTAALAFACAPVLAQEQDAKKTFEKAAYAEEHERDFEGAAKLYEQAAREADAAKDEETAKQARAGFERIQERLGKKPEAKLLPLSVRRRILDDVRGKSDQQGLVNFGAAAVPDLAAALLGKGIVDPGWEDRIKDAEAVVKDAEEVLEKTGKLQEKGMATSADVAQARKECAEAKATLQDDLEHGCYRNFDPDWAAQVLAEIPGPEALAALTEGYASEDPYLRLSVVKHLDPVKHRALLDRAVNDPFPDVRGNAIVKLTTLDDPALLDLMVSSVRVPVTGLDEEYPARWLAHHDRDATMGLVRDETLAIQTRALVLGTLCDVADPQSGSVIDFALGIGEKHHDQLGSEALGVLEKRLVLHTADGLHASPASALPETQRARLEAIALGFWIDPRITGETQEGFQNGMTLLMNMEGLAGRATLAALVSHDPQDLDTWGDGLNQLLLRLGTREAGLTPADMPNMVALMGKLGKAGMTSAVGAAMECLAKLASGARAEDIIHGFDAVPAEMRHDYVLKVVYCKATMPRGLEPIVHECLASQEPTLALDGCGMAWELKDPSFTAEVFARVRDLGGTRRDLNVSPMTAFAELAAIDPRQATALVERELATEIKGDAPLGAWLIYALDCFPTDSQEALIERAWPSLHTEAQRSQLGEVLVRPKNALFAIVGLAAAAPAFLAKHFHEVDENVRAEAVEMFGGTLYEPALPVVGEALRDPSSQVRAKARAAFGLFKAQKEAEQDFAAWQAGDDEGRAAVAELEKLLDSDQKDVVLAAIRSLGGLKAKSALPKLVKLLDAHPYGDRSGVNFHPGDPDVKKAVDEAIARITG